MEEDNNITHKRLLFIGVGFRNYDELIIKELSLRYEVLYINSKEFDMQHRILYKIQKKYGNHLYGKLCSKQIFKRMEELPTNINRLFVIKGEHLTKEHLDYILKHNTIERAVLYLWDKWSAHENIDEIRPFFNDIFSFDTRDCKEKGLKLRPLFYFKDQIKIGQRKTIDVAFVGNDHTGRYELLKRVKKLCLSNGLSYKFCLLIGKIEYTKLTRFPFLKSKYSRDDADMFSESGVPYEEYLNIISSSKTVLDIQIEGQTGLTMRTIESLIMGARLITSNKAIIQYEDIPREKYFLLDECTSDIDIVRFLMNAIAYNQKSIPERYECSQALMEMI